MDINEIKKFQAFIYEAAYIALKSEYFEGHERFESPSPIPVLTMIPDFAIVSAMERILWAANISSREKCEAFLKEYDSAANRQNAKYLCDKYLNPEKREFFSGLTPDELILYHSANFDISREYGNYLGESFHYLPNMSIADIGGSSGGLLTGIADKCKNVRLTGFDTEIACEVGRSINDNIDFIPCDFFKYDFNGKKFDIIILSNVLHDWSTENVILLLKNLKPLFENCKFLIIHEDILSNSWHYPRETLVYGLRLAINEPGGTQRTFLELDTYVKELDCGLAPTQELHFPPLSARIYKQVGIR